MIVPNFHTRKLGKMLVFWALNRTKIFLKKTLTSTYHVVMQRQERFVYIKKNMNYQLFFIVATVVGRRVAEESGR